MRIHQHRLRKEVLKVARVLLKKGFKAYIVGGAVRDLALRRIPKDWDVATSATPKQIQKAFRKTIPTGIKYGTVTVICDGLHVQATTYRSESGYRDQRRPTSVKFLQTLQGDLSRRDFTMNAMAIDPTSFTLIDPFGGLRDLKKGQLRTVGSAIERFKEDTLRAMRAGRFIGELRLKPDSSLSSAAKKVAKEVKRLSPERIRDELEKLLLGEEPSRGFIWLDRSGILPVILPEVVRCKGVRQGGWHKYDVFRHTLIAIDQAEANLTVRMALLLHDIAKPKTRTREGRRYHFYRHERIGAEMAQKILRRLRFPNRLITDVDALVRHHLFEAEPIAKSEAAVRRLMKRVGEERLKDLLEVRRADIKGCGPDRKVTPALKTIARKAKEIRKKRQALTVKDLAANGMDVMRWLRIKQGPIVGKLLHRVLEEVLVTPQKNTKKEIKKFIKSLPI